MDVNPTSSKHLSSDSDTVRVLIIAHDSQLYGAQMSLLDILRKIDRSRFALMVLVPSTGPFTDALDKLGIPYISGVTRRWIFEPRSLAFRDFLCRPWRVLKHPYLLAFLSLASIPLRVLLISLVVRRQSVQLIYTNTATVLDGAIAARLCHIPHIWHLRERIADNRDLTSPCSVEWLPEFFLRRSSIVIANSNALASQLFGINPPAKVNVVHNGVDIERFFNLKSTLNLPDVPADSRLTAICGIVSPQKGVETYIRAVAKLRHEYPNLHHLIIGNTSNTYRLLVEQEILKHELEGRVHLLGYRTDIPELLGKVDVYISASVYESFGRTIIEAMAAGKPVVATRSGGPQEIIEDGISGFLVDVGDAEAMASQIAKLLDDPERMKAMGQAAKLRAARFFDLGQTVIRIEHIFSDTIKNSGCSNAE